MNTEALENCLDNRCSMKAISEVESYRFRAPKIALITGISGQASIYIFLFLFQCLISTYFFISVLYI